MNVSLAVAPPFEAEPDVAETPATDSYLLEQASSGDDAAWEALVRRYAGLVNGVASRYGLQEWDRADVFQAVWEELWENCRQMHEGERLPAWLVRTAGRRSWQVLCERQPSPESPTARTGPAAEPWQPAERIMLEGQWATLTRSVEQLPPHCRHLVHAMFFDPEHPGDAEVAARANESGDTLRCRSEACLHHLRDLLVRNVAPPPQG